MLPEPDAAARGALVAGRHRLPLRIYYEDTDFSRVVYHASYLRFFERGRTELLRAIGFQQSELHRDAQAPLAFVVRRMTIDFLRPARMDDVVVVETAPSSVRAASIELSQKILRGSDALVLGLVSIVAVADGRARRLPAAFKDAFEALLAVASASN
jgi:acyl-CoA thioester hydrolase